MCQRPRRERTELTCTSVSRWAAQVMDSDESINLKSAYFLPQQSRPSAIPSIRDAQLAYAKAHARLIRVAPVWTHYAPGATLGRGHFATVRHGTRRAAQHVYIPPVVAIKVSAALRPKCCG